MRDLILGLLIVLAVIDLSLAAQAEARRHHRLLRRTRFQHQNRHLRNLPGHLEGHGAQATTLHSKSEVKLYARKPDASQTAEAKIKFRPQHGSSADIVSFGIFVKDIFSIDMKTGTWTADIVISSQWTDPRVKSLLPDGHHEVFLSQKGADDSIWSPDIFITNGQLKKVEPISSVYQITQNGTVMHILRTMAALTTDFHVQAFPFDSQELKVRIASRSLMAEQLELVPMTDKSAFGLADGLLEDFDFSFEGFEMKSFLQVDGLLEKVRGELGVKVKRRSHQYIQQLLVPELLIVIMSWATFWFPLAPAFGMPRVATALISFLSLLTMSLRTNKLLPTRGGMCWMDMFEEVCEGLMFFNVVMNIMVESIIHTFDKKELAKDIDHQLKIFIPVVTVIAFTIIFCKTDGTHLSFYSFLTVMIVLLAFCVYILICLFRLRRALQKEEESK